MRHRSNVEVDQSIKIEVIGSPTFLAFSNDESYCIIIPSQVKRAGLDVLRQQRLAPTLVTIRLFAAALFLLLREHLPRLGLIQIDLEYRGHENDIKAALLRLIRRTDPTFVADQIVFRQIGKHSSAHHKAWRVQTGKAKADRRISRREFLAVIK